MVSNFHNYPQNLLKLLKSSWFDLLHQSSANLKFNNQIFVSLVDSYSDNIRSYHNLQHIHDILNSIELVREKSINIDALQFSAWFHDYIYNPQASNNESESATYAVQFLQQLNIDLKTIKKVEQIILSTKNHLPLMNDLDNLIFLDVDLAILGTTAKKYQQYAQAIRQEYKHIGNRDYQRGRKKVLTQFLARKKIYYTDYFYQQLESMARENIKAEIYYLDSIEK